MKKLFIYASILSVFLVDGGAIAQSSENKVLDRFVRQYEGWKTKRFSVNPEFQLPWKPYMNRPFYEGLSLKDKNLYLSLQESGDCLSVVQLDLIGFLTLYPFLTRAFERKDIRASFEDSIARQFSDGTRRCWALWSGRRASPSNDNVDKPKAITLPLKKDRLSSGPFSRSNVRIVSDLNFPKRKKENAFMEIYYLAICRDYMPAIRDLEEYLKKKEIILTPIDRTYLSIRSAELGMKGIPSAQLYKKLNGLSSHNGLKNKEKRSIEMQLFGSIEINFQTYYAKWCGPRLNRS